MHSLGQSSGQSLGQSSGQSLGHSLWQNLGQSLRQRQFEEAHIEDPIVNHVLSRSSRVSSRSSGFRPLSIGFVRFTNPIP
eukprot:4810043-Heterocapsa_arctica.AAC.1